jgi:hypothetical protein
MPSRQALSSFPPAQTVPATLTGTQPRQTKVSVCLATFNGALYLLEQVTSILAELNDGDELVVVDDASNDETLRILHDFNDSRIHVHRNDRNLGHVYSFGRCISLAQHDAIILSDQDDRWLPGRVDLMVRALQEPGTSFVWTNSKFMGGLGEPTKFSIDGVSERDSRAHVKNIADIFRGKTNYYGCALAFHRRVLDLVLPIPAHVESHDLWIALIGNVIGENTHLDAFTLVRRIHGSNASIVQRPFTQKLRSRIVFLQSLWEIGIRLNRRRVGTKSA